MPASSTRRRASSSISSLATPRALRAYVRAHPIVAFTKTYCPYCQSAVRTLRAYARRYGTTVSVVELDTMVPARQGEALQRRLARVTGRTTVPNVFIGGEAVGGGDEVEALREGRRLGRLVKATMRTGGAGGKATRKRAPSPPTKSSGGATRDERAAAAEYRQRYWTPKHVYKRLCGIVHADDTLPGSPFALPTPDATWTHKARWRG